MSGNGETSDGKQAVDSVSVGPAGAESPAMARKTEASDTRAQEEHTPAPNTTTTAYPPPTTETGVRGATKPSTVGGVGGRGCDDEFWRVWNERKARRARERMAVASQLRHFQECDYLACTCFEGVGSVF